MAQPRRVRSELTSGFVITHCDHPALLRLQELETLRDLSRMSNARIYISLNGQAPANREDE